MRVEELALEGIESPVPIADNASTSCSWAVIIILFGVSVPGVCSTRWIRSTGISTSLEKITPFLMITFSTSPVSFLTTPVTLGLDTSASPISAAVASTTIPVSISLISCCCSTFTSAFPQSKINRLFMLPSPVASNDV